MPLNFLCQELIFDINMKIIDGKKIAEEILEDLKPKIQFLEKKKFFAALLVGDDKISLNFLKQKKKIAERLGVDFRIYNLEETITTDKLRDEIGRLSRPKNCGAFTVQLPLPFNINTHYVLNAIPKEKDVDLLSERSIGSFYTGRSRILPPSVSVVKEIIKRENINLKNLKVAVLGYGSLIGKPVTFWLTPQVESLSVFERNDINFQSKLKHYDLIISGVGKTDLFNVNHLKDGAIVIDFGYSFDQNNKLKGDFCAMGIENKDVIYTPTPGGTGPILVAKLFENFWILNN